MMKTQKDPSLKHMALQALNMQVNVEGLCHILHYIGHQLVFIAQRTYTWKVAMMNMTETLIL